MAEIEKTQKTYIKLPEALCAKEGVIIPVYLDKETYGFVTGRNGHPFCMKLNRKADGQEHGMIAALLQKIIQSYQTAPTDPQTFDISGKVHFEGFMLLENYTWTVSIENDEPVMRVDYVPAQ